VITAEKYELKPARVKEENTKQLFHVAVVCTKTDPSWELQTGAVHWRKHKLGPLLGYGDILLKGKFKFEQLLWCRDKTRG
jgi:hypothetical protein